MAAEVGQFIQGMLIKLPEDHPDRAFLQSTLHSIERYTQTDPEQKDKMVEFKCFSAESRELLERRGFSIFTLSGQSVSSLKDAGRKFWSTWHEKYADIEQNKSLTSEVAIDSGRLVIPGSNWKSIEEQMGLINAFSDQLASAIPGVQAVMGEIQDYADLVFEYFDRTGGYLLEQTGENYIRTKTLVSGSISTHIGAGSPEGLIIGNLPGDNRAGSIYVAPLVIPA